MARIIIGFALTWLAVTIGIIQWRELTKKEKWSATKTALFGFGTATISTVLLAVFVFLF